MATLSVWTFPEADGARQAETTLATLAARELITVEDAAMVAWPEGKARPRSRQLHNLACTHTVGDAFWGLLFGVVFYLPFLTDATAGEAMSSDALCVVGIGAAVVDQIRANVKPGTSALFVLSTPAVADRAVAELAAQEPLLVRADLTAVQKSALREVFAH